MEQLEFYRMGISYRNSISSIDLLNSSGLEIVPQNWGISSRDCTFISPRVYQSVTLDIQTRVRIDDSDGKEGAKDAGSR